MRLGILLIACSAAFGLAAANREWNKQYTVTAKPELVVRADDGRVEIRPGSADRIEARVVVEGWEIGPSGVRIDERQTGNRVDIEVRIPKSNWKGWEGKRSVRVELRVPTGVRADVKTADGSILADGLSGEFRLHTSDGSVQAIGLDGTLDAETGDGSMKLRGRFDGLRAKTGDGSIEAEIAQGSKMSGQWEIRTGDGSITLRLPENFAADLDADTGDGKVTIDMPVTVSGRLRESGARGKLNGGGPILSLHSGDGSIRIAKL